jgi:hypothetical protein
MATTAPKRLRTPAVTLMMEAHWRPVCITLREMQVAAMKGAYAMGMVGYIVVWILCVILGAIAGFALGWIVWQLGFELIGSAIALVGAGVGGIAAFLAFLAWKDRREESRIGKTS